LKLTIPYPLALSPDPLLSAPSSPHLRHALIQRLRCRRRLANTFPSLSQHSTETASKLFKMPVFDLKKNLVFVMAPVQPLKDAHQLMRKSSMAHITASQQTSPST
jgi:hypothetical protein